MLCLNNGTALGTHARTVDLEHREDDGRRGDNDSLDAERLTVAIDLAPGLLEVANRETSADCRGSFISRMSFCKPKKAEGGKRTTRKVQQPGDLAARAAIAVQTIGR